MERRFALRAFSNVNVSMTLSRNIVVSGHRIVRALTSVEQGHSVGKTVFVVS